MSTSQPPRDAAAAALAASQQLVETQMRAVRDLQELNLATARAAIDAMSAWQSLGGAWTAPASARASSELQQALADYPRRAAEICMRATEAWVGACTEQSRQWQEVATAALSSTERRRP